MKIKTALIGFIFFINNDIKAQSYEIDPISSDTINFIDAKGKKQGKWFIYGFMKETECYKHIQLIEAGEYLNNKKTGIWTEYFCTGYRKNLIEFNNGLPEGKIQIFNEKGGLSEAGFWKNNHWVGKYEFYYKNGNKKYEFVYNEEGKRNGIQKYFFENGNLAKEINYINGFENGLFKEYNEKGELITNISSLEKDKNPKTNCQQNDYTIINKYN